MADRFRRRPLEVEAVQFIAGKPGVVREFIGPEPIGVKDGNRVVWFIIQTEGRERLTLHPGQWVIKDAFGAMEVYWGDEFAEKYEPVEEA